MLGVLMFHFFFFFTEVMGVIFYPFSPLPISNSISFQKPQLLIFLSIYSSLSKCSSWEQIAALFPFFFQFLVVFTLCSQLRCYLKRAVCVCLPTFCHYLNQKVCVLFICFLYWALPKSSLKRGSIASKIFRNYCSNPDD